MRTINLNGYIDEDVWYGDEITPAMLHDALYGEHGRHARSAIGVGSLPTNASVEIEIIAEKL